MTMNKIKCDVHKSFKETLQNLDQLSDLKSEDKEGSEQEKTIVDYLGRLKLLEGLPLNYLVAQEEMLPSESIRFFYIDDSWITALIDGACSLGSTNESDSSHNAVLLPKLHRLAVEAVGQIRNKKLYKKQDILKGKIVPDKNVTGFLLHSIAVSAFPGLEAVGYTEEGGAGGKIRIPILRMEHLANDILICIFSGRLDSLEIHNPPEGLHFGFDLDKTGKVSKKMKRMNSTDPKQNGLLIEDSAVDISEEFYRNDKNILKVEKLVSAITKELEDKKEDVKEFTSAEFALQMIEGVDMASLERTS